MTVIKLTIILLIIIGMSPARNVHHMHQMWLKSTKKLEIFSYLRNTSGRAGGVVG